MDKYFNVPVEYFAEDNLAKLRDGKITINQIRTECGLPRIDDGDVRFVTK